MRDNMDMERDCTQLGNLFHSIVTDLKSSSPAWEDFVSKGTKLHNLLKSTTIAVSAFIESIQKIADMATNSKGSTKDIGSALTRICVRQKMMENKMKHFTSSLMENLVCPVQERLEEWKKVANQLEKDHTKDYKKAMHEVKKRNSDAQRLQKKVRKGSKPDMQYQLTSVTHDVTERLTCIEESEKTGLKNLLVEERSRICLFANSLAPVLNLQVAMLNEVAHLQDLTSDVTRLCGNPKQLPISTEQLVKDFMSVNSQHTSPLQDIQSNGFLSHSNSPPPSPSGSRKSSLCSLNSLTSSDSRSSGSLNRNSSFHHRHYQGYRNRTNSGSTGGQGSPTSCQSAPPGATVARLSSVSSHDSGFVSTGNGTMPLNSLPLGGTEHTFKQPPPINKLEPGEDVADGVNPIIRSRSNSEQAPEPASSLVGQSKAFWKDWSKPGPYDPPPNNNTDTRRNVLPSKTAPPLITPKPACHRSASMSHPSRPPFLHANTTTCFFPDRHSKEMENFPPPPPQLEANDFTSRTSEEDTLPPPPPALLNNVDAVLSYDLPPYPTTDLPHQPPTTKELPPRSPPQQNAVPRYIPPNQEFHSMTLGRKTSINSLQYSSSSGYSSQNTTPACSEDTIASHDTDYGSVDNDEASRQGREGFDYEKFSTLPRNYHRGNPDGHPPRSNHRRPASIVGLPASGTIASRIDNGAATIRRKPSSKFNSVRRTTSVPKAVQPPTIPVNAVSNLMSTFMPPAQSVNTNGNNSIGTSEEFPPFHGVNDPSFPQARQSFY